MSSQNQGKVEVELGDQDYTKGYIYFGYSKNVLIVPTDQTQNQGFKN